MTIQMKAIEQYFNLALFIMLCTVYYAMHRESVRFLDETLFNVSKFGNRIYLLPSLGCWLLLLLMLLLLLLVTVITRFL